MRILRVVKAGWRALGANRMRTLLAMLGITIGIGAVVAVVSIGEGTQREIERAIEAFGTNLLVITPGETQISAGRSQRASTVNTLVADDAQVIASELREVELAVPVATKQMEVSWEGRRYVTSGVHSGTALCATSWPVAHEDDRPQVIEGVLPWALGSVGIDWAPCGDTPSVGDSGDASEMTPDERRAVLQRLRDLGYE